MYLDPRRYRSSSRSLPGIGVVPFALYTLACGTPAAPVGAPTLVVAGSGAQDTIDALIAQPLTARLEHNTTYPLDVSFVAIALPAPTADGGLYEALVAPPAGPARGLFTSLVVDSATPTHDASALVQLGSRAGIARVVVAVPELNLADTVTFTVRAGAVASVSVAPRDTVVYLTGSASMRVAVRDRGGNPAMGPFSLAVQRGPATIGGARFLTVLPSDYGTVGLAVQAGAAMDTTSVMIAPTGTLAAVAGQNGGAGPIAVFNIDGSGYRTLTDTIGNEPRWSPSGGEIVFENADSLAHLLIVDTNGVVRRVDTSSVEAGVKEQTGVFSADGRTIYFTRLDLTAAASQIYRVPVDGSAPPTPVPGQPAGHILFPAPSPDGSWLAFCQDVGLWDLIGIVDLTTSSSSVTNLQGYTPVWSPADSVAAFVVSGGSVTFVRSNGTPVSTMDPGVGNIDWSPDGKWLVGWDGLRNILRIVNATSGVNIPLPFTAGLTAPTWRPRVVGPAGSRTRARAPVITRRGRTASGSLHP